MNNEQLEKLIKVYVGEEVSITSIDGNEMKDIIDAIEENNIIIDSLKVKMLDSLRPIYENKKILLKQNNNHDNNQNQKPKQKNKQKNKNK